MREGKTRGIDKTSGAKGRTAEEEESSKKVINRDKVAISIGRITTITPLKARITQEDTLCGFGREFILPRSDNMNKTNTTKDTRREVKERLSR